MKCLVGTCFNCQVSLLIKQLQFWRDTLLQPSKPANLGMESTPHLHSLLVVYVRPTPSVLMKVKGKACYLISELVNVKGGYIVEHTVELKMYVGFHRRGFDCNNLLVVNCEFCIYANINALIYYIYNVIIMTM